MNLDAVFQTRDIAQAAERLADLERFATKRDSFIDGMNEADLDPNQRFTLREDDERICETIAFGHFYLVHLADLETHACGLRLAA